jgi:hypothetical protein
MNVALRQIMTRRRVRGSLALPEAGIELPLDDLYDRLTFPA